MMTMRSEERNGRELVRLVQLHEYTQHISGLVTRPVERPLRVSPDIHDTCWVSHCTPMNSISLTHPLVYHLTVFSQSNLL